jgi:4-oxalocrotonate tautomerase family enzyme
MPLVQITMLQGRTAERKRKPAKAITDAIVEEAGTGREAIVAAFTKCQKKVMPRAASR